MGQFASDSFAGTAGTELSAHDASWVRHTAGSTTGINVVLTDATRFRSDGSGYVIYYHTAFPATADYSVSLDIYEASEPSVLFALGVLARSDTTAITYYLARQYRNIAAGVDAWQLYRAVAGSFTQLGSNVSGPITTGTTKTLKLDVSGSSTTELVLYVDGVAKITYSDTTTPITAAGKAGIRVGFGGSDTPTNSTTYHGDNFSADEVSAATIIGLTAAALGFTPKNNQLGLTNQLSTASLDLTPQSTQLSLVARVTAATFDFIANAITVATSTAATVVSLTAATFGFVASSAQLSLQNNLAATSFDLAALPVTNRLAARVTTALLTFAAQPTQNLLVLGLTAASLRFVARAITVTGAISGAIKQFMTLMGIGK